MRLELNDREYNYRLCSSFLKCNYCMWKICPTYLCVKFCRTGYVFRTGEIAPSIFHL